MLVERRAIADGLAGSPAVRAPTLSVGPAANQGAGNGTPGSGSAEYPARHTTSAAIAASARHWHQLRLAVCHGILLLACVPQPPRSWGASWAHSHAPKKW